MVTRTAVGEASGVHDRMPLVLPQEPTLDEAWVEPDPFGGCSIDGQSKPDQPQPIHFVRHSASLTSGAAK